MVMSLTRKLRPIIFVLLTLPALSFGDVAELVKDVHRLVDPKPESVVKVSTARIALADYGLIRHDFPSTRSLSEEQIDQWLLNHVGYMSKSQVSQSRVNTPIPVALDGHGHPIEITAFRPQLYGRALVYPADDGYIDAKGVGSDRPPQLDSHQTGLGNTGEMIREFMYQKKVQQIFDYSGSGYRTVACYAVIDWGFDAYDFQGHPHPAGAVLRQAQPRPRVEYFGNHFAGEIETKKIEDLLRHFGLTSDGDTSGKDVERANIQVSANGEIVDFGAFLSKPHFGVPYKHYLSGIILSDPANPNYVQPDPAVALPESIWGSTETGVVRPRSDNPWVEAERIAVSFRSGSATRTDIVKVVDRFMTAGHLPESGRNSHKDLRSAPSTKTLEDIIAFNITSKDFISQKLITEYVTNSQGKYSEKVLDQLLDPVIFKRAYSNDLYEQLKKSGIFASHPDLRLKLAVNGRFSTPEILLDMLAEHREHEILQALDHGQHERIGVFLSRPEVMQSPFWPKFILAAAKTDNYVATDILKQEPSSANHPEMFKQLLKASRFPVRFLEVLEQPHWQKHPELVDDVLKTIAPILAEKPILKEQILRSFSQKPWEGHPRQKIWQNLIIHPPQGSCAEFLG